MNCDYEEVKRMNGYPEQFSNRLYWWLLTGEWCPSESNALSKKKKENK